MPKKIAIIGAGFSGTMVLRQLLNLGFRGCIDVFQQDETMAQGPAYSDPNPQLLLNVRSANMSAFPDDKQHFLHYLEKHFPDQANPNSFCPRYIYGHYLKEVWNETMRLAKDAGMTIAIHPTFHSEKSDHTHLVLATGNELPRIPKGISVKVKKSPLFQANPWKHHFPIPPSNEPIFILGNGLTMVDTVLKLRRSGAKQQIVALSRHGYHMLSHPSDSKTSMTNDVPNFTRLNELLPYFNSKRKEVSLDEFLRWIDTCRPYLAQWWQGFMAEEKRFFLQHLRHLWGTVRHRIPAEIAEKMQEEESQGGLSILAGRLLDANMEGDSLTIRYTSNGQEHQVSCSLFINCTGPETSIEQMTNPSIQDFLQKQWIQADSVQQGILIDPTRHLACGISNRAIYPIGNLCKGTFWESTAIGELRSQAIVIAKDIIEH